MKESVFLKSTKGKAIVIAAAAVLLAAIIAAVLLLSGGGAGYRNIYVSKVSGSVMAKNGGNEYKAYENMRLADGYVLTTGADSYARLAMDDDKYVKIDQKSRAVFTNVGNANSHVTAITIEYGTMTSEVVNPLTEEESFVVTTPNAVLAVRGTMFKVGVDNDGSGKSVTDVYTFGGTVSCRLVLPDGTVSDEEILITKGSKSCIVSEGGKVSFSGEPTAPISMDDLSDEDIVDIYNASSHGHAMFLGTGELWQEIADRDIDLSKYDSAYGSEGVPSYTEKTESTTTGGTTAEPNVTVTEAEKDPEEEETAGTESTTSAAPEEETASRGDGTQATEATTTAGTTVATTTKPVPEITTRPEKPEHRHEWGEYVSNHDATCTKDGTKTARCIGCGAKNTVVDEGSALGHEFGHYVSNGDVTCTEDGTKTARCIRCDAEDTVVEKALGHDIVSVVIEEPTMTEEGLKAYYCRRCGEPMENEKGEHEEIMPKLEALYVENGSIIITETGYIQGWYGWEIPYSGDYVIVQKDPDKTVNDFFITVMSGTHSIVLDGLNVRENNSYQYAPAFFAVYPGASAALSLGSENTVTSDNYEYVICNSGELIIESGAIAIAAPNGIMNSGSLEVEGGSVKIDCGSIGIYNFADYYNTGSVTEFLVSGGSVEITGSHGINNSFQSEFRISGGSVTIDCEYAVENYGDFTVDGEGVLTCDTSSISSTNKFIIDSGTVTAGAINNSGENFAINGGTVTAGTINSNSGIFTINGGRVTAKAIYSHNRSLTVKGGSVTAETVNGSDTGEELLMIVIGGSLHVTGDTADGIIDNYGNVLECIEYEVYPGDLIVVLQGCEYVYELSAEDAAEDGKYYVWVPLDRVSIDKMNSSEEASDEYDAEGPAVDADGYLPEKGLKTALLMETEKRLPV